MWSFIENYFPSDVCFPVPMPLTSSGVHPSLGYLLVEPLLRFGNVVADNNNDRKPVNLCNSALNCEGNETGITHAIKSSRELTFLAQV